MKQELEVLKAKFRAMPRSAKALAIAALLAMVGGTTAFAWVANVAIGMSGIVDDANRAHTLQHQKGIKFGANVDHSTTTIHGGHSLVTPGDSLGGFMSGADKTRMDAFTTSSTDNAICRFNGTSGGTQTSLVSIDDTGKLTGLADGTASSDGAAFHQIGDAVLAGKQVACDALTTTNQATLSGLAQTIDGVALNNSNGPMRACVFGQTTTTQDGCYVVASGAWTRCTDLPSGANASNRTFITVAGSANKGVWSVQPGANIVGTNDLVVANQASGGGGGGTIGGTLGATDNTVPRSDGTGAATLQASSLVIDDTGLASGITFNDPTTAQQPVTLAYQQAPHPAQVLRMGTDWATGFVGALSGAVPVEGFISANSGTGAAVTILSTGNSDTIIGVAQACTGTTTTGLSVMTSAGGGTTTAGGTIRPVTAGKIVLDIKVSVPTLSNGTDTFNVIAGLVDSVNTLNNGIWFSHDANTDTHWTINTKSGGTATTTNTTATVTATQEYHLVAIKSATVDSVQFFVDNVSVGTISTNIPTTANLIFTVGVKKSAGTTSRCVNNDWLVATQTYTRAS